jgi:hypothetical protein
MYPHERSLVERMANRPFALVGVNSDTDLAKLRKRLDEEKITWPSFWCGEDGTRGGIPSLWNVSGWPTIYFIDHEGVIRQKSIGSPDDLDAIVDALVATAEEAAKGKQ